MKKKKAVILGVTGQDGSYLLEFLLSKNYEVHGLIRKAATTNTVNINHLINNDKLFNKNFESKIIFPQNFSFDQLAKLYIKSAKI